MAIAYDNSDNRSIGSTSASYSFTTAGSNITLLANVFLAAGTVSSITYGGQNMTLLDSDSSFGVNFIYYLNNSPSGAQTFSVSSSGFSILEVTLGSYNGVVGGLGANNKLAAGSATSTSNSITTTRANSWVAGMIMTNSSPQTFTASGSAFTRNDGISGALLDTNGVIASPSSVTMGASWTFSTQSALFLVELKESANTTGAALLGSYV